MAYLVKTAPGECSWVGICAPNDAGKIVDIIVPTQVNSAASTEFHENSVLELCKGEGYEPERIVLWGHSHATFACFFSGTDISTAKKLGYDVQWSLVLNHVVAKKILSGVSYSKTDYYLRLDINVMGLKFTAGEKLGFQMEMQHSDQAAWAEITLDAQATEDNSSVVVYTAEDEKNNASTRKATTTTYPRYPGYVDPRYHGLGGYSYDADDTAVAQRFGQAGGQGAGTNKSSDKDTRQLPAGLLFATQRAIENRQSPLTPAEGGEIPYIIHALYYEGVLSKQNVLSSKWDIDVDDAELVGLGTVEHILFGAGCEFAKQNGAVTYYKEDDDYYYIVLPGVHMTVPCVYNKGEENWRTRGSNRRVFHDPKKALATQTVTAWTASSALDKVPLPTYLSPSPLAKTLVIYTGKSMLSLWPAKGDTLQSYEVRVRHRVHFLQPDKTTPASLSLPTTTAAPKTTTTTKATEPPPEAAPPETEAVTTATE